MTSEPEGFQRRRPKQSRSRATCEAILEAASQILERSGPAGFNTASVAERAGVSIGTLYQYFPDKQAILLAAAQTGGRPGAAPGRQTALMRALIEWLETLGRWRALRPSSSGGPILAAHYRRRTQLERELADWARDCVLTFDQLLRDIGPGSQARPDPDRCETSALEGRAFLNPHPEAPREAGLEGRCAGSAGASFEARRRDAHLMRNLGYHP